MELVWTLVAFLIVGAYPVFQEVRPSFVLPACDDEKISKTPAKILTEHGGGPDVDLSNLQTLADADKSRTCQATWSRHGGDVPVNYNIVWDGWTPQVKASWRR